MFKGKKKDDAPRRRHTIRSPEPVADVKSFRPGRTLTGSRSSQVATSNELNGEMISPRAHVHHLVRHRRRVFGRLLGIVAVCIGLYLFMGQLIASTEVQATTDAGAVKLTSMQSDKYMATADDYFSRRINERFRPNLNESDLTNYMRSVHPEIQSLEVELTSGFGDAQLQLEMRRPVARWVVDGETEFVDQTGVVFAENYYPNPEVKIIDKNATEVEGGLVASNRFLSFVGQVVGDLEQSGLKVTKATIPLLTTRQLEVKLKGIKYYFKLTVDRSAGEQAEDIARIVNYFKRKGDRPSYIDVRVKGKAFYK